MAIIAKLVLLIVILLIFALVMKVEPRTLFSGALVAVFGLVLFSFIQDVINLVPPHGSVPEPIVVIVHLIGRLLQLVIAAGPFALALLPIFMGVMLIKKEGAKIKNIAGIFFGCIALIYVVVLPLIGGFKTNTPGLYIYVVVTVVMVYFIMLKTVFTASSIVNQIHRKGSKNYQYILVLGTDLEESRIEILLEKKVNEALELYKENPGARLIFTGADDFEGMSEGRAMAEMAKAQGVPVTDIIIEEETKGAEANIKAAYTFMIPEEGQKRPRFALVSGAHHVLRPLIIARINRIKCKGYGAKESFHYRMNAFIIEYMSYLKRTKKRHIFALSLVIALAATLITLLFHYIGTNTPQ